MAVERAECWNTHGAFGVGADDLVAHLWALNADVSSRCEAAGREPSELRRSVLLFGSLSPWNRRGRLAELVEEMCAIGYEEMVVFWPWDDEARVVFEHDAGEIATLAH